MNVWYYTINYSCIFLHISEPLNGSQLFLEVGRIDLNNNMKKNLYSAGDPPTQIILVGLITKLEVLMMEEASKRLPYDHSSANSRVQFLLRGVSTNWNIS